MPVSCRQDDVSHAPVHSPDEQIHRYPADVVRRWSDALAGAGLFALALEIHPDDDDDVLRRAELAVLAADHATALRLLKHRQPARKNSKTAEERSQPSHPAVAMLLAVAQAQAGQDSGWPDVQAAATDLGDSPWTSWMLALGGITPAQLTPAHLAVAGPAARRAFTGGCRDPRLPVIAAAGVVSDDEELSWEHCAEAIGLLEQSRRVQLPGEDAIGGLLDLLRRAGLGERARSLAAFAVTDRQVSAQARDAWRAAAQRQQIPLPQRRRRAMPRFARLPHRAAPHRDLICRCAGSTGWIGPDRLDYVEEHLKLVDDAPIPGFPGRLLQCQLTGLRFLDLAAAQLTLPVDRGQQ